jgi:hypothetical protein
MTDAKKSDEQGRDDAELQPEIIADLDPEAEQAEDVKAGGGFGCRVAGRPDIISTLG